MTIITNCLAVIGAVVVAILVFGFIGLIIKECFNFYVDYRIIRTNQYINMYCRIIDNMIHATVELSYGEALSEEKVKELGTKFRELINDYNKIRLL